MKNYILVYWFNGKSEEILKGDPAFLQAKKAQLKRESHFQKGRLTIISEEGFKHNPGYVK